MARGGSSGRWLQRQAADSYVRQRDQDGYRSRAAYKLAEINQRDKLIKPGSAVLDLGAAPGGWTQFAAGIVGKKGTVIALDVLKMDPLPGATVITGDCRDAAVREEIINLLGDRKLDLVLSDMAPNISGIALQDEARMSELAYMSLEFCQVMLKPGGALLIKLFQFAESDAIVAELKRAFRQVARRKPDASRTKSREFYVVAKGFAEGYEL